jgi:hypothetical protein
MRSRWKGGGDKVKSIVKSYCTEVLYPENGDDVQLQFTMRVHQLGVQLNPMKSRLLNFALLGKDGGLIGNSWSLDFPLFLSTILTEVYQSSVCS